MSITVSDDDGKQDDASHGGLGRDEVVNRPPAAVSVQSADGDSYGLERGEQTSRSAAG
ncbi:hypothetical protein F443_21004 [Phytophthora nicotianae P1569]|uniref:Uncharacterized protein n=1 Tax=Phytophthora nicotianae P1569 TaxID=1317065 RepID=V9DYZ9_PHYNI|nr:hypothetical protein F443_21004 [Phytophthora nicotianae P1569]